MRNKMLNYWYSLGDSARSIIVMLSFFMAVALLASLFYVAETIALSILFFLIISSVLFVIYLIYDATKTLQEEYRIRYENEKRMREFYERNKKHTES